MRFHGLPKFEADVICLETHRDNRRIWKISFWRLRFPLAKRSLKFWGLLRTLLAESDRRLPTASDRELGLMFENFDQCLSLSATISWALSQRLLCQNAPLSGAWPVVCAWLEALRSNDWARWWSKRPRHHRKKTKSEGETYLFTTRCSTKCDFRERFCKKYF